MDVNFEIRDLIYIRIGDTLFDLHNDFDFLAQEIQMQGNILKLHFRSNSNAGQPQPCKGLFFTAFKVNYLAITEPNLEFLAEDSRLDGITFYPSADRQTNNALIDQAIPTPTDDLLFQFLSDRVVRIKADRIHVETF